MTGLETWELLSYVVTVVGLPFAIVVFMFEQRKERQNEDEEIYQRLSDEYADFLQLLLENADLRLMSQASGTVTYTEEQAERKHIIFELLTSLFERAFILVYEPSMNTQTKRLWSSWEDYIRYWCRRKDYRDALKTLLEGEDPDFEQYILQIAAKEAASLV
ncbi:MAG: hypothetical protein IT287_06030 [Bdellovibrionaceae bacterium]|nr:hypothetical protein [Pseudobdellovibrionaceae bacterium]